MAMCLSKNSSSNNTEANMETSSKASTNGGSQTPTSVGAVNTSEFTPRSSPLGGAGPRSSPPPNPPPTTTTSAGALAAAAAGSIPISSASLLAGMLPSALAAGVNPLAAAAAAGAGLSPSPPTLVPSAMSMVSMASMLGHPGAPHFLHPGAYGAQGPRDSFGRHAAEDFAASMSKFMDRSFGDSPPPPTVPTNDPTANECKIVEYRGEKVAAFVIAGKTMLCLPQVFELFLKHLVGGLHTVYTKLKRLEITPIVCNVEQVRILRGLGAIQPGVNRCKLLADVDFDALYKDCTTTSWRNTNPKDSSRPGRPPKRGVPFPPMSPQDAMLHLKNSMHVSANGSSPGSAGAGSGGQVGSSPGSGGSNPASSTPSSDPYKDIPYSKEPRLDKSPFGNGFGPSGPAGGGPLNPMAAQFMALNHPGAAHAAFLSQTAAMSAGAAAAGFPGGLPNSSPSSQQAAAAAAAAAAQLMKGPGLTSLEALQRSGLLGAAYFERMREGQGKPLSTSGDELQVDLHRRKRSTSQESSHKDERQSESPVLNLSKPSYPDRSSQSLADCERGPAPVAGVPLPPPTEDLASDEEFGGDGRPLRRSSRSQLPGSAGAPATPDKTSSTVQPQVADRDKVNNNLDEKSASSFPSTVPSVPTDSLPKDASQLSNVYGLIGNIQALLKAAVENTSKDKGAKPEVISGDSVVGKDLTDEIDELKRNTQVYLRRIKKEKRHRKKLQEQLERETRRRVQMEEALRVTSAETLKRITDTFAEDEDMDGSGGSRSSKRRRVEGGGGGESDEEDSVASEPTTRRSSRAARRSRRSGDKEDKSEDEDDDELLGRTDSSPTGSVSSSGQDKQYNATVSAEHTSKSSSSGGGGGGSRDPSTPTLGIAKNLFPFNGSSLFTSAN